ncbi:HAD family hydrolase [Nitratifractor sp.]
MYNPFQANPGGAPAERKAVDLIVFDMDGTLLDSRIDITISINHVRALRHGLPPLSEEEVVDYINREERNLPLLLYGTPEPEPEDRRLFVEHYREQCTRNVHAYPGIPETLAALSERGVTMAVATNASTLFARRMLKHLGLLRHFISVVGADSTGYSKPDPAMLRLLMEETGFRPEEHRGCLVGDSGKDMKAAANAGLERVFARWGYSELQEADRILEKPSDLIELIERG